jgi:NADH dehydrogenase FAD-containing subunit
LWSKYVTLLLLLLFFFLQKRKDDAYYEVDCFKINATKMVVHLCSAVGTNFDRTYDLENDYDYLVVALGGNKYSQYSWLDGTVATFLR